MIAKVLFTAVLGTVTTVAGYAVYELPQRIDQIDADIDRIGDLSSLNLSKINQFRKNIWMLSFVNPGVQNFYGIFCGRWSLSMWAFRVPMLPSRCHT